MPISKVIFKASSSATPEVWMDSTTATAIAEDITAPKTAMLADGVMTTGTGSGGGGGGGSGAERKDVNFYDYDGSIVASYTAQEFASLSALPANPSHEGLTAQGWNWSQTDAKTYVQKYGRLDVGEVYKPTDGKTHIFIHIPDGTPSNRLTFSLFFYASDSSGTIVDWGDGSPTQIHSGSTPDHTYAQPGDYEITLDVTNGIIQFTASNNVSIFGSTTGAKGYMCRTWIKKLYFGDNVTYIGDYGIQYCYALECVVIPRGVLSIGNYAFYYNYALKHITIPDDITTIGTYAFQYSHLKSACIPNSVTNIGTYAFSACYDMGDTSIPDSISIINSRVFQYHYPMSCIIVPDSVTEITSYAFGYCYSVSVIRVPDSVTSISTYAFYQCYGASEYHFERESPPTLAGINAFNGIPSDCVMYVPYSADHSILNAYKTATNWSNYASYMQEEPQS